MAREKREVCKCRCWHHSHSGSAVYGLGFIGALVYYISQATSFEMGVIGFLKALVWPAFLVFHLLKFLGMYIVLLENNNNYKY